MTDMIDTVIQTLQPAMEEYSDNGRFFHWMDYACELDDLAILNYKGDKQVFIDHINKRISDYPSGHAKNHACTDVASTVESLVPEYKGVFKYV